MLKQGLLLIAGYIAALSVAPCPSRASEPVPASAVKWDCLSNQTGLTLRVVLASELHTGTYVNVAPGEMITIQVGPDAKTLALLAFEEGKNELVTLTSFQTLPQAYPPKNCYPITKTTSPKALNRIGEVAQPAVSEVY